MRENVENTKEKENFLEYYKTIGLNIAYYRKRIGYSQIQLAEKINISRTHLSNIEAPNMNTHLSLDTLFRISNVLNVTPESLLRQH